MKRLIKNAILYQLVDAISQRRFNVASDEIDEARYQECLREAREFLDERSREEVYARM